MPVAKTRSVAKSDFRLNDDHLMQIRYHPHILGHIAGKTLLTEMHSKWIRHIWDTTEDRALQGHRKSYKTTAVAVIGPIWWWLFWPDDRIGYMRKKVSEAWDIASNIMTIITETEVAEIFKYAHGIYPRVVSKNKHSGKITFSFKGSITPEGSLNVYGLVNTITGAHLDRFLGDDFITLKDRISKAEREHTKNIIREVRTNIMERKKPSSWIGTPWHPDDGWTVCPKPIMYNWKQTGLLTQTEYERIKAKTTPSLAAANYDLKHIASENVIFSDPTYGPWDWSLKPIYGQLDAKYHGDHTGAVTFAAKRKDGRIQMTGWIFYKHVDDKKDWIKDKCEEYGQRRLYNEINADKGYVAKELRGLGVSVKTYSEKMNKHIKIVAYLKKYWREIVWDEDIDEDYMAQILDYQEGVEPDDGPDSAASLLREAFYGDLDALYRL